MDTNILKNEDGYLLLERYGRPYIHFLGGRNNDLPCEVPVTEEEKNEVLSDTLTIDKLIRRYKRNIPWTAENFYRIGVTEYLIHKKKLPCAQAEAIFAKYLRHPDMLCAFYGHIMEESLPEEPLAADGFSA